VPRIDAEELRTFGERIITAAGVVPEDARLLAEILLQADLRGYSGHGLSHLISYIDRWKQGINRLDGTPEIVRNGRATALVDGHFYIGQIIAHRAMALAIEKAREHGVGVVSVRQAGHFGRLADWVEMAAEAGMIGFASVSVGGGNVAPYGARQPATGTNPMAFGVPGRNGEHLLLDFATSAMSMGELMRAVARQDPIPLGVMIDHEGNPTTDFRDFRGPPRGATLPFGGHKGGGLSLMCEVLGGILSGNGIGRDWLERGASAINAGFFEAVSVEEFLPLEEFLDKVDELKAFIRSRQPAPGFTETLMPGDRSRRRAAEQLRDGVEIEDDEWAKLLKCAAELGVQATPAPR
jgi:LDH2 family malate/lactate/ureidoglycolate dehydrogenase